MASGIDAIVNMNPSTVFRRMHLHPELIKAENDHEDGGESPLHLLVEPLFDLSVNNKSIELVSSSKNNEIV